MKRQRIHMRGGPGPDHDRFDKLVRERLIPGGFVLLYQPDADNAEDGILVMSPLWSLLMAHMHGRRNVITDAKVDTVHGEQWKWSSVRALISGNVSVLLVAWIARFENTYTIETALRALKACVQCTDDQCNHPFTRPCQADACATAKFARARRLTLSTQTSRATSTGPRSTARARPATAVPSCVDSTSRGAWMTRC